MRKYDDDGTTTHPSRRNLPARLLFGGTALGLTAALACSAGASAAPSGNGHVADTHDGPRTIITTDPELDDLNSMLRVLLYANEIDIDGIVVSASQHHYSGNPERGLASKRWPDPADPLHVYTALDAYEAHYANLAVHDPDFPTPESLRAITKIGNIDTIGDMEFDTEGSDLIKAAILDDEPGQLFLQAWGGPNTIARALKSIEDQYKGTPEWDAIYQKVIAKVVITSWGQQDSTFANYIKPNWPEIENREVSTSVWGYGSRGVALPEDQVYLSPEWTRDNVSDVGAFGAEYRVWGDGKQMAAGFDAEDYFGLSGYTADELRAMGYGVWTPPQAKDGFISEGDSSNFALLIDNGLRSWVNGGWGGWGGRQTVSATDPVRWTNRGSVDTAPDGSTPRDYTAARWWGDIQRDFAARLQWTVTADYADANHEPAVKVAQGIEVSGKPGATVPLTVVASDPDGDAVSTTAWQYREAGTYAGTVGIVASGNGAYRIKVPADAQRGDTIHVIVESTDDGAPALTSYQRVVITVA